MLDYYTSHVVVLCHMYCILKAITVDDQTVPSDKKPDFKSSRGEENLMIEAS
jgi:hypothetical protein